MIIDKQTVIRELTESELEQIGGGVRLPWSSTGPTNPGPDPQPTWPG